MSARDVKARAEMAREWMAGARLVLDNHDAAGISHPENQVVSSAVHAGIAAADAICGHYLRVRSSSGDHGAAVLLLEKAGPNGKALANDLKRLITEKTNAEYSAEYLSAAKVKALLRSAQNLTDALDTELRV